MPAPSIVIDSRRGGPLPPDPEALAKLIGRAVAASGTDLTRFALTHLHLATQQVLAEWERINQRPARSLKGLRVLMDGAPAAGLR